MADRIKGITVEIGGDTTGLKKALSGVNSQISSTQSQLKDVERLLKLDPTNTELLQQKQRLLSEAVGETKTKLTALKDAESQAQQQFAEGKISQVQYEGLQREIAATEQSLKKLETQAQSSNATLSKISATADKVAAGADKVAGATRGISTAAGAGLAAISGSAVKLASEYEDSLAKVSTIADTTKKSIDDLSNEVLTISDQTGASATEINEALYQAISAGADTADATKLVETAVKSAKGGFTDTTTAVDGLTSVLNTYDMATSDAEGLANKFLVTQNKGKTTFGELASSIGKVAPTAASVGVSVDELLGSVASLTANGIGTSEAMSGMKAALSNIIKPTADAQEAAQRLGIDFSTAALQSKGLSGFLADVQKKTGGNVDDMSKLFGSVEALNTVLTLTSDNGMSLLNDTMGEMTTNTTAVDDAFNKITATSSQQFAKSLNEVKNEGIELGNTLMPLIDKLLGGFNSIIGWIKNTDQSTQMMILSVLAVVAAISPVAGLISGVSTTISGLSSAMGFLAANPIVLVIAAIAALVTGLMILWNTNEGFRTAVTSGWDAIQLKLQAFQMWLDTIFSTDWTTRFGIFGNILNSFFANAKNVTDGIRTALSGVMTFIKGVFSGDWQMAWQGIQDIFRGVFQAMEGIAKIPLNGIIGLLNVMIDGINFFISGINKALSLLSAFGVSAPQIPELGKLAYLYKGGILSAGSAIVGERGPELLTMIGGSAQVTPLTDSSRNSVGGIGSTEYKQEINIYSHDALSPAEIARENRMAMRKMVAGATR